MTLRHFDVDLGDWVPDYSGAGDTHDECSRCGKVYSYYYLYNYSGATFAHERNASETGYVCGACLEVLLATGYIDSTQHASITSDPVWSSE